MRKITHFVLFLFFLVLSAPAVFSAADSYNITSGSWQVINEWGLNKNVTNNCPATIYVPTNTSAEWFNFVDKPPLCARLEDEVAACIAPGDSCGIGVSCCSGGSCINGVCGVDPCGPCHWSYIECSHYGGIWNGPKVPCDLAHEGVIVMMSNSGTSCGSQSLEQYTSEYWDYRCFTARAKCDCGTTEPPADVHSESDCVNAGGEAVDTETPGLKQCKFQGASCPSGWKKYKNWMTTKAATHTAAYACSYGCCAGAPTTATNPGHGWSNNDAHYPLSGTWCSGSGISYDGCEGDGRVYCGAFQALGDIVEIGCY